MKVITITSCSGGEGKTTTVFNLAYFKAKQGKKVLMIDLDYEGGLTKYAGLEVMPKGQGSSSGFTVEDLKIYIQKVVISDAEDLYILPADKQLYDIEDALRLGQQAHAMKDNLKKLENDFDYIFIDTPSYHTAMMECNSISAADEIILVSKIGCMDERAFIKGRIRGLTAEKDWFKELTAEVKGVIVTKYHPARSLEQENLFRMREDPELNILGIIRNRNEDYSKHIISGYEAIARMI